MFGMSRSVQTMTFMPLASVVVRTWSSPGTRAAGVGLLGLVAAPVAAPIVSKRDAHSARTTGVFGMQHLNRMRTLYGIPKRKAPHTGEVVCGAEEANTGEELFADLYEV